MLDREQRADRAQRSCSRFSVGMNTPEMNHSGSIVAWTIGWAASGEPITPETASRCRRTRSCRRGDAGHRGDRAGRDPDAVGELRDHEQQRRHDDRDRRRRERLAGDQHCRRHRGRAAALEHAGLAQAGDRDHQVGVAGDDDRHRQDAGHVERGQLDAVAVDDSCAAAEHAVEDDQQQDRKEEREEPGAGVAQARLEVVADLVGRAARAGRGRRPTGGRTAAATGGRRALPAAATARPAAWAPVASVDGGAGSDRSRYLTSQYMVRPLLPPGLAATPGCGSGT